MIFSPEFLRGAEVLRDNPHPFTSVHLAIGVAYFNELGSYTQT